MVMIDAIINVHPDCSVFMMDICSILSCTYAGVDEDFKMRSNIFIRSLNPMDLS